MSKRKPKKEVHQPDDKLFKIVMETEKSPEQYLITYYPKLAKELDMSTFKIQREKFSIPNLKVFDADVAYHCKFKNSDQGLTLSFLWENKSQPEEFIAVQVGLYLFLRYYKMVKTKGATLEPIIPLIFYNGEKDWTPKTMNELFQDHSFFKIFRASLPNFKFHFTNIKKIPRKKLLAIEMAFFRSAMVAMANKHDYDLLLKNFSVIFDVDDEDHLIAIGTYVFAIYERLPEKVQKEITQFDYKIQDKIMSTLAILKAEGKAEGKIEGEEIGMEKGMALAVKIKKLHRQKKSPEFIAKELNLDVEKVKEMIQALS